MVDLSDEFEPTRYNLKGQEIQSFGFRFINKLRTNHKEGSYCKIKRKKKNQFDISGQVNTACPTEEGFVFLTVYEKETEAQPTVGAEQTVTGGRMCQTCPDRCPVLSHLLAELVSGK